MPRRRALWIIIAVLVLVPAGVLAWWLASPLFISKTVREDFPFAANAVVPKTMTRDEVEKVMTGMAKVDQEMTEDMSGAMEAAETIKRGLLRDGDSFHKGSGQAVVYRLSDGSHLLRLENLKVTNGPALHVLLAAHPDPKSNAEVQSQGYVDLGKLKGNLGNQNYEIPRNVDVSAQRSVVIYCKPFQVVFSVAPLQRSAQRESK